MCILHNTHITCNYCHLCDNIGLIGVSAKWSYVTASPSHHDQAIPILSPLLFMHVGHPYIPLFKSRRIFDLLVTFIFTFNDCCLHKDGFLKAPPPEIEETGAVSGAEPGYQFSPYAYLCRCRSHLEMSNSHTSGVQ